MSGNKRESNIPYQGHINLRRGFVTYIDGEILNVTKNRVSG